MYLKDKRWSLSSSASHLDISNLCQTTDPQVPERRHLGVIHKNSLNLLTYKEGASEIGCKRLEFQLPGSSGSGPTVEDLVIQAKWVTISNIVLLVICSHRGIQIYEWDGSLLLYWKSFSLTDTQEDGQGESTFARGVAACGANLVCVGCWDGSLFVFRIPLSSSSGESIQIVERPLEHMAAVSSAWGKDSFLATGDDTGAICLWTASDGTENNTESALRKINVFDSQGSPVTGLCLWHQLLVASYGSGHLRVFDVEAGYMRTEITAHAKWITGLDLADESGLVISASEDSYFRVWRLNEKEGLPTVSFVSGESVKDSFLCGANFLDNRGHRLALSTADCCDLHIFKAQAA